MAAGDQAVNLADGLPRPEGHMPALDSLRGVAILAVLLFHGLGSVATSYAAQLSPLQRALFGVMWWGYLGVHLFFVLSGFLITGILLDTRERADYYRNFYTRRALRILPALLLMLVVLRATNEVSWTFAGLALLFVANFGLRTSGGGASSGSPLWTLSVEEQFYLVWPAVIRKLKPRHSFTLALAIILVTPGLRFVLQSVPRFQDIVFKTWAVMDFFAAGAALAFAVRLPRLRAVLRKLCVGLFAGAAVLFGARWVLFTRMGATESHAALATFLSPLVFLFAASTLAAFLHPALASTLPGRALAFLGSISYGLYLCQTPIHNALERHWPVQSVPGRSPVPAILLRFGIFATSSIGVAWLSRSTYEAWFLKLKGKKHDSLHELALAV